MLLSITIPTYNRATLLKRCLNSVLPQVKDSDSVEVVVIDNASPDNTREIVREFFPDNPKLRYYRNDTNLGYAGNQAKCFEYAHGKYAAILCDDDVYRQDALDTFLPTLEKGDFSFVALNYYGFVDDPNKPLPIEFAKEKDVLAENAYSILEHPSVGHYSGFVFNVTLARKAIEIIFSRHPPTYYEKYRGVFSETVVRVTKSSALPGYFVGKTIVGAGLPPSADYDGLRHVCMDYYELFIGFFEEGLINKQELDFRKHLVLTWLPKAILRDGCMLSRAEFNRVSHQLREWFRDEPDFFRGERLLRMVSNPCFRLLCRVSVPILLMIKREFRRLQQCFN